MFRISILMSSKKGGHKFPAEALATYIVSNFPDKIETRIINLLDYIPVAYHLDKVGRWCDLKLRRLWKFGYASLYKGVPKFSELYKRFIAFILGNYDSQHRIEKVLEKPDLIISFQPEVNCIAGWLHRKFNVPIYTVVMDYSAHIGWTDKNISKYFVSNSIVHDQLIDYGVSEEKILITGAPPQKGFEEVTKNSMKKHRQGLGIKENLFTILIMGGFLGKMVDYMGIIESLISIKKPIQLLVVVGRNRLMYERIKNRNLENVYPYFFVPNIHTVMWAADLVISKPGGMVIADSLSLGKPMMLIDPVAGSLQEIIFADIVEKQGVGIHLRDTSEVKNTVQDLLSHHEKLKMMAKKSFKLGEKNRNAAKTITENIIKTLNLKI